MTDPSGEGPLPERVLESRRLYDGRIMSLRVDAVLMPNGREATREIVEHAPVVAVVPVDENGDVVMVRQFRLATGDVMLEIPAGLVDEGEEIESAAQRELQEEIGYRAGHLERLSGFFVSPGFCTEFIHVFLALGLEDSDLDGDEDEDIVVERLPLAEAVRLVEEGAIRDAKSIVGILMARERLKG
ncbi:MAG TPA: NUDIX hydrolase [Dehalococcoidia bacterium]|nr:NUDIX hydrolase [Dehalococcoidia bacterium]